MAIRPVTCAADGLTDLGDRTGASFGHTSPVTKSVTRATPDVKSRISLQPGAGPARRNSSMILTPMARPAGPTAIAERWVMNFPRKKARHDRAGTVAGTIPLRQSVPYQVIPEAGSPGLSAAAGVPGAAAPGEFAAARHFLTVTVGTPTASAASAVGTLIRLLGAPVMASLGQASVAPARAACRAASIDAVARRDRHRSSPAGRGTRS